jgi:hypothetical protein
VSEPVFDPCPSEWANECGCPESHNYCWPEPLVNCCAALVITPETPPEQVLIIDQAKRIAVQILHAFSGRQFGLCRRSVRPCRDGCNDPGPVATAWVDGQLRPILDGGVWYNRDVCGTCAPSGCGCAALCEVTLPGLVQEIIDVRLNGDIVDPTTYRVDNHRKLVRVGADCWPTCQDLRLPDTEDNTFSVTYLRGKPVPEGGRWASGLLACELIKACSPAAGECALPDNVTSVTREGLTLDLAPFIIGGADGAIAFGRTGVPEVDMWLVAVNPNKLRSRSRAYSPDRPNPRRSTWPCPS